MAIKVADRVKETTSTTGTGTITLAGAASGYFAFTDKCSDGDTVYYVIESGSSFEVGVGTFTASGTTLSRDTILSSSNSGSAITLSGTSTVFSTLPADAIQQYVLGPPVTKANVENTAAETDFLSFAVPANTWQDGDIYEIWIVGNTLNNTGSTKTALVKVYYGTDSGTPTSAVNITTSTSQGRQLFKLIAVREGNDLWVGGLSTGGVYGAGIASGWNSDSFANSAGVKIINPGFSTTKVFKLSLTFSAADANLYFKPLSVKVRKL